MTRSTPNPSFHWTLRIKTRKTGAIHSETGLSYNWNRYYDSSTGRYDQSDPIGLAGGLNTYLYTRANPLRYIDPLGLWSNTTGGYEGPGGEWTWGTDSGNGFVAGRVGFSAGGGWSY